MRSRRAFRAGVAAALAVVAVSTAGAAPGAAQEPDVPGTIGEHRSVPEDRYALAGGCYALGAEPRPFHAEAVDLGRYLFTDPDGRYLVSTAADVTTALADAPSPAAEWDATEAEEGAFTLRSAATGASRTVDVRRAEGCGPYPDVEIGVSGPHDRGETTYEEVRGYLDAHLHVTAFEFLGGRLHCGRPWHPYGVAWALVDCPDHELADGAGAIVENLLTDGVPVGTHDPVGWPTFRDWPAPRSLTHEQTYHRWIERAWRGGLRILTNLVTDNRVLCEVYPLKRNSCDEMAGVALQVQRLRELERYIDARNGGPGEGWFRIVDDPAEARAVANQGRLAVVLGIELSEPFGCSLRFGQPQCTAADVDRQLDELHALGVRHVFPVHKLDNALAGTTGDGGSVGQITNTGNFLGTGRFWELTTCDEGDTGVHDHDQSLAVDPDGPASALFAAVLQASGVAGQVPAYPPPHHCNVLGLSALGAHAVDGLIRRGMLVDVDHMSVRSRQEALDRIEAAGYSGVLSSHGWATPDAYPRVWASGGIVAPYAGSSTSFVKAWRTEKANADPRYLFGLGFGADSNGLGHQGGPRGADVPDPVTYPFTGFGGTTIDRQVSGARTYDVNVDGVAHYGLYPDWIEDLRRLAGDEIVADLERGPEAYLQMWERAVGVPGPQCLTPDSVARLRVGLTPWEVLTIAGQPTRRTGPTFDYCGTALHFDAAGRLVDVPAVVPASRPPGPPGAPAELPATGTSTDLLPVGALLLGLVLLAARSRRRVG